MLGFQADQKVILKKADEYELLFHFPTSTPRSETRQCLCDSSHFLRLSLLGSLQDVGEEEGPERLDARLLQQDPLPHHRLHNGCGCLEQHIVHLTGLWGGGAGVREE